MSKTITQIPFCSPIVLLLNITAVLYEERSGFFEQLEALFASNFAGIQVSSRVNRSLDEGGKHYEPKLELFVICNFFL